MFIIAMADRFWLGCDPPGIMGFMVWSGKQKRTNKTKKNRTRSGHMGYGWGVTRTAVKR